MGFNSLKIVSLKLIQLLLKWVLRFCIAAFVIVALYLSLLRYYLPKLNDYRQDLSTTISYFIQHDFSIKNLQGHLEGLTPYISADEIILKSRENGRTIVDIKHIAFKPSLKKSILNLGLYPKFFKMEDATITLQESAKQTWSLLGSEKPTNIDIEKIKDIADSVQIAKVNNLNVAFIYQNEQALITPSIHATIESAEEFRRIKVKLFAQDSKPTVSTHTLAASTSTTASGHFIFEGSGPLFANTLTGNWTFNSQQLDLSVIEAGFIGQDFKLKLSGIDADLSGQINVQQKNQAQGFFNISDLDIQNKKQTAQINGLRTDIAWEQTMRGADQISTHDIWLKNLGFNKQGIYQQITDQLKLTYRSTKNAQQLKLIANEIHAEPASKLLTASNVLVEHSNSLLKQLSLKGNLIKPQFFLQNINKPQTKLSKKNQVNHIAKRDSDALIKASDKATKHQQTKHSTTTVDANFAKESSQPDSSQTNQNTKTDIAQTQWEFSAQLQDVSCDAERGIPAVNNLNAQLWANNHHGLVLLKNSQNLKIHFADVYDKALHVDEAQGMVSWSLHDYGFEVYSNPLNAKIDGGQLNGWFSLMVDFDENLPSFLTLNLGAKNISASAYKVLVPNVVNKSIVDWLDESIISGRLSRTALLLSGGVGSPKTYDSMDEIKAPTLELAIDVENAALQYQKNWPTLTAASGVLWLSQRNFDASIKTAKILNSRVKNAQARLRPILKGQDAGSILNVDGVIHGDSQDLITALKEAQLSASLSEAMAEWSLSGSATTDLDLQFNIGAASLDPQVKVTSKFDEINFHLAAQDLEFKHLNGSLHYDLQHGLSSNAPISASLFGFPVKAKASQQRCVDFDSSCTVIKLNGEIDATTIQQLSKLPILKNLQGTTAYQAQLEIPEKNQGTKLRVTSTGEGIQSTLPAPFNKSAEDILPVSYVQNTTSDRSDIQVHLKDVAKFKIQQGSDQPQMVIALGEASAKNHAYTNDTVHLLGNLEAVDIQQWQPFVKDFAYEFNNSNNENTAQERQPAVVEAGNLKNANFKVDSLFIKRLSYEQRHIDNIYLDLTTHPDNYQLHVTSDVLSGAANYSPSANLLDIKIKNINIAEIKSSTLASKDTEQDSGEHFFAEHFEIENIPDIDFVAEHIHADKTPFGKWSFNVRKHELIADTLIADNIQGEFGEVKIGGNGTSSARYTWSREQGSNFNGRFTSDAIGAELDKLGYDSVIKAKTARLDANVYWQGSIFDFSLLRSQGTWDFALTDGYLLQAPATATGVLKIISIANLTSILSDLRLSIGDLAEDGLRFNTLKGVVNSGASVFETAQPLKIKGASSEINIDGFVNARTGFLDAELVVTIPIRGNLPWVVALAGGLPAAAGVFIATKFFKNTVDELSSLVYKVSGSMNEPKVKFKRLFDFADSQRPNLASEQHPGLENQSDKTKVQQDNNALGAESVGDNAMQEGDLADVADAHLESLSPDKRSSTKHYACNYFICF